MRKTKLTPPTRIKIDGQIYWRIVAPSPTGGRIRRTFKDRADARIFHEQCKVQIAQFGAQSMEISDRVRGHAIEGMKLLEPYGASLIDAVKHYVAHLESRRGGVPLSQAIDELLLNRKSVEVSARYVNDLRLRLGRFKEAFPDASTRSITTANVGSFLEGLGVAASTTNTFRRDLRTLFEFAVERGYVEINPVRVKPIKCKDTKIEILSVDQTARLLKSCDPETLPSVAIAAFCGLRQAEIGRLDWSKVDLDEKIITVDADIAKTGGRRVVDIPDCAINWLAPYSKDRGKIMPSEFRILFDRVRVRAGFKPSFEQRKDTVLQTLLQGKARLQPWPANCLRHSAISYRLSKCKDIGQVATVSGNSPSIIKRNYLELVKPSAADAYFKITPSTADGKIIKIASAFQ
jgi:integrase